MATTPIENDALEDRLLEFASRCGKVVDALPDTRMGRHVAGQLVRCGTSAAPNYAEACAAESRADFIHKLRIALKELHESRVWLKLCVKSQLLPPSRLVPLKDECTQLVNILGKSIVTAKANGTKRNRTQQERPLRCTQLFSLCTLHFALHPKLTQGQTMSFQIECPNCGCRPVWEFHYGGPSRQRPDGSVTERQWAEFLYNRPNIAGEQTEWWYHRSACKLWFQVRRDTRTNKVLESKRFEPPQEPRTQ